MYVAILCGGGEMELIEESVAGKGFRGLQSRQGKDFAAWQNG